VGESLVDRPNAMLSLIHKKRESAQRLARPNLTTNSLRASVITADTKEAVQNYLAFRHFFRQAYVLRWEDMRNLVEQLESTWRTVNTEIETFISQ